MAHETWHTKAWMKEKIKEGKEKHGSGYPETDAQIDFIYGPGSVDKEMERLGKEKKRKINNGIH